MRVSRNIVVDLDLWLRFLSACRERDSSASREIRRMIVNYLRFNRD